MNKLIVLRGAMGVGKSTVGKILKKQLTVPVVHYDWLRRFHLDDDWSQAGDDELEMAFQNLVSIVKNYFAHSYQTVIVDFLYEDQITQLPNLFKDTEIKIITLLVNDDVEMKQRVLSDRDSGWTLHEESIKINEDIRASDILPGEVRIDTTHHSLQETVNEVLEVINP